MKIVIQNEQTLNKQLAYDENIWTGKKALEIDGSPCEKLDKKTFSYVSQEGESKKLYLTGNFLTGVNTNMGNGEITLVPATKWYEYLMSALFFVLIFTGGAIGGALGGLCFVLNILIIKNTNNIVYKILITLALLAVAFGLYYLIAFLILG